MMTTEAVLAGTGAERERDVTPRVEVRRRGREMQNDAAHGDDHVDAQFEQALAQPRYLGARARGVRGPQAEFLHEDVRGGREEHAQLIGPEATAARASDLEPLMEFLDPIFNVAAGAVDVLVDEARRLPEIRDDKARVVARLAARQADDFGLDDDATLAGPRPSRIARLGVQVLGLPAGVTQGPGLDHRRLGMAGQHHGFGPGGNAGAAWLGVEGVPPLRSPIAAHETVLVTR